MFSHLGKRKRHVEPADALNSPKSLDDHLDYQESLRRHFEATFEPVEPLKSRPLHYNSSNADEDVEPMDTDLQSDWSGLSETDDVQVVSHESVNISGDGDGSVMSGRRQFMSSKPPAITEKPSSLVHKTRGSKSEKINSAASLTAEDLALQRLLSESHLLSGSTTSALLPNLKARQAAQDLRLQGLGAKKSTDSIGAGNMPMALRRGIQTKKRSKEQERRKEAKEAGIVLEREARSSKDVSNRRKRPREVAAPAVGKWRGGTLVLGKKDVAEIESQRLRTDFGKRGKGSRKGKRR